MKKISLGDRVVLQKFNGKITAPNNCDPLENYWSLIGMHGTIVSVVPDGGIANSRVLIQFDSPLTELGLHNHNRIENSLWILKTDIQEVNN